MNLGLPDFKLVFRGYDRREVEDSWAEITRIVTDANATNKELKLQNNSLHEQNNECGNRLKIYENLETDLRDAMISAHRITKQIKEEAEQKAEELLSLARLEADTILSESREEIQRDKEEANRLLLEHQNEITDLENKIFELITIKNKTKQKIEKTTTLLDSIHQSLQEMIEEE